MRYFHQAIRIRAIGRADHQNQSHFARQRLHRFLAILRRIANIIRSRPGNRRKPLAQPRHNFLRVIKRQRSLRQKRQPLGIGNFEHVNFFHAANHQRLLRRLARGADNFLVIFMPNQNQRPALARKFQRLQMNFGHQRTGSINHAKLPLLSLIAHPRRHAMRAKNQHRAHGHFLDRFHKNRPAPPQLVHYIPIMDNLVVNIYRRAISLQRQFHNIHRANHPGAKPTRAYPYQRLSPIRSPMNLRQSQP